MRKTIIFCILSLFVSSLAGAKDFYVQWSHARGNFLAEDGEWLTKNTFTTKVKTGQEKKSDILSENAQISIISKSADFVANKTFPAVTGLRKGDCVVFSIPGVMLEKGAKISMAAYFGIKVSDKTPIRWKCEIQEGGKWKAADDKEYSFKCYVTKPVNETYYFHTFTLAKKCTGTLQIRCKLLDDIKDGMVYFPGRSTTPICTICSSSLPVKDLTRILLVGNSFTMQQNVPLMLQQIALSQGHELEYGINVKGGMDFTGHLKLPLTLDAIAEGGYKFAFLQNLSVTASSYASDPETNSAIREGAVEIAKAVRKYSPDCRLILERTWAFSGKDGNYAGYSGFGEFDAKLDEGSALLADAMRKAVDQNPEKSPEKNISTEDTNVCISPIGNAFAKGREAGLKLYYSDNKHQSKVGAYLKACVNYLMIFGGDFSAPVPCCGISPANAADCQQIARSLVSR